MLVNQWMTRQLISVGPTDTLASAAERMARNHLRRVLVMEDDHLVGILARSDVLRAAPAGTNPFSALGVPATGFDRPVHEAMAAAVVTVPPDLPIEDAARLMSDRKIGALPVVANGRTMGLVTRSDLFRAFIAMLGENQAGVRLSFDITDTEDAVAFAVSLAQRHAMRVASVSTFEKDGRRSAVVRLVGREPPGMLDEVWKTGHRVLSVVRWDGNKPSPPEP
jgi:acetoin utilization protein AcuB